MSWASRRRALYGIGTLIFLLTIVLVPASYWYLSQPASCTDGKKNQGETAPDRGGPCPLLDERALAPLSLVWARAFPVRAGSYNAVAYVRNRNDDAGVRVAHYRFGLYDESNTLIAQRTGTTFIMPGVITPVFQGGIETGNRTVAHTYFEFTEPLTWERLRDRSHLITINDRKVELAPSAVVRATAHNTSVEDMRRLTFIVSVLDPAGNAFAASQTTLEELLAGDSQAIVFAWPQAFQVPIGTIDIMPLLAPVVPRTP